ncbi:uncharacterized protein LOC115308597 [Ixodes scapularis]|uniref:uncharacterized protein LOC115308597 n=1 Tax=Ixodes scapularis TaxID=6945 RepID=UPI001AD65615|nr:uncharacterized protein LOC115308597 [Ixodes scapularis]
MAGSIRCGPLCGETNAGESECCLPSPRDVTLSTPTILEGVGTTPDPAGRHNPTIPRRFNMPLCSTFRVSGFGRGLEMRPMNFQSAVPDFWVCSFCRVIASKVVLLSCFHSACEACFAECLREDKLCPLDQVPIEDDVQRVSFSTKKLGMLKVSCWNAPNGCDFSGSCMDVLQHFEQDCGLRTTSCPSCDALVPRDDVVEHLRSACTARVIQVVEAATSASMSGSDQRAYLEMKQLLEKIRDDHLHLQSSFNRLSEQANIVSARQHESYETGVTRVVDLIHEVETGLKSDVKTHMSREVSELNRSLSLVTKKVSLLVSTYSSHVWVLEGWRNMTDGAHRGTLVETESPLRSVRGYLMSQVVKMAVDTSRLLRFTSYIRIHSGPFDDDLEWPFHGMLACYTVNPKKNCCTALASVSIDERCPKESFGRPVHGPNSPYLIYEGDARILEDGGSVVDGKLFLKITVL